MKVYISYFYTVRFFTPNMIPFSTAMWDPKWYHANSHNQKYAFFDKRGVINGLKADPLIPDSNCNGLCRGPDYCNPPDPDNCQFLKRYMDQLESIPFDNFMTDLTNICNALCLINKIEGEPIAVILVHEAPTNPCSERIPLMKWFHNNGVDIQELDYHQIDKGH